MRISACLRRQELQPSRIYLVCAKRGSSPTIREGVSCLKSRPPLWSGYCPDAETTVLGQRLIQTNLIRSRHYSYAVGPIAIVSLLNCLNLFGQTLSKPDSQGGVVTGTPVNYA